MPHAFAPLFGTNSHTMSPLTGSWTAAKNPAFPHSLSPFQQLFSDQIRWWRESARAVSLSPYTAVATVSSPRQALAATGDGLPFAAAGASPIPGITVESFTYTRMMLHPASLLNAAGGGVPTDPSTLLAELFSGDSAPPLNAAIADGAHAPLGPESADDAAPAPTARTPEEETDALTDPVNLGAKIGKSIDRISSSGLSNAEFAVDHPRYGRVEAGVEVSNGGVTLSFAVEDGTLRSSLESARGEIERALREHGLTLAGYEVGTPEAAVDTQPAVSAEELVASAYRSHLDAALSRIISDMASKES